MEESEEYQHQKKKYNETDNKNRTESFEGSSNDPIPSLLLPIKKIKKVKSAISHIISNLKNKKMNLNQIQAKIRLKKISYNHWKIIINNLKKKKN